MGSDSEAPPSLALRAVRVARREAHGETVEADDAARALRLALQAARITLPDLRADDCTCGLVSTLSLVELGSARADVALRLAEVISLGAVHEAARAPGDRSPGPGE